MTQHTLVRRNTRVNFHVVGSDTICVSGDVDFPRDLNRYDARKLWRVLRAKGFSAAA